MATIRSLIKSVQNLQTITRATDQTIDLHQTLTQLDTLLQTPIPTPQPGMTAATLHQILHTAETNHTALTNTRNTLTQLADQNPDLTQPLNQITLDIDAWQEEANRQFADQYTKALQAAPDKPAPQPYTYRYLLDLAIQPDPEGHMIPHRICLESGLLLETVARHLCFQNNISLPKSFSSTNVKLRNAKLINFTTFLQFQTWYDRRNHAAHGGAGYYHSDLNAALSMHSGVKHFITQHFSLDLPIPPHLVEPSSA